MARGTGFASCRLRTQSRQRLAACKEDEDGGPEDPPPGDYCRCLHRRPASMFIERTNGICLALSGDSSRQSTSSQWVSVRVPRMLGPRGRSGCILRAGKAPLHGARQVGPAHALLPDRLARPGVHRLARSRQLEVEHRRDDLVAAHVRCFHSWSPLLFDVKAKMHPRGLEPPARRRAFPERCKRAPTALRRSFTGSCWPRRLLSVTTFRADVAPPHVGSPSVRTRVAGAAKMGGSLPAVALSSREARYPAPCNAPRSVRPVFPGAALVGWCQTMNMAARAGLEPA